jgi:hypothetical protein
LVLFTFGTTVEVNSGSTRHRQINTWEIDEELKAFEERLKDAQERLDRKRPMALKKQYYSACS